MTNLIPILVVVAVCVVAIMLTGWLIRQSVVRTVQRDASETTLALLQNQINASAAQSAAQLESLRNSLAESIQALNVQVSQTLADSNKNMGQRLDTTSRVIGDVRQQLGQLEESSKRILEVGKDINKLEQVLSPPKLRGNLGELFLSELLAQILPTHHYALQHRFKGGETVDAVVILQAGLVPIDAKFPLEEFQRIFSADNDDARKAARKAFSAGVRKHIDAIASKYIRMDEKTFDFALMYIPAENVYYETIIKDDELGGDMALFSYALKKRVIPVSPNSFYAYLQTIFLGLKGMQVEERARDILQGISRLQQEFDRFSDAFRLVGQHLDNSSKKFADAQNRFGKVEAKMDQITGLAKGIEPGGETLVALPGPEAGAAE